MNWTEKGCVVFKLLLSRSMISQVQTVLFAFSSTRKPWVLTDKIVTELKEKDKNLQLQFCTCTLCLLSQKPIQSIPGINRREHTTRVKVKRAFNTCVPSQHMAAAKNTEEWLNSASHCSASGLPWATPPLLALHWHGLYVKFTRQSCGHSFTPLLCWENCPTNKCRYFLLLFNAALTSFLSGRCQEQHEKFKSRNAAGHRTTHSTLRDMRRDHLRVA